MPWYTRRVLVGGAASVCIALVGVAVVWNTLRASARCHGAQARGRDASGDRIACGWSECRRIRSRGTAASRAMHAAATAVRCKRRQQVAAESRETVPRREVDDEAPSRSRQVAGEQKLDERIVATAVADAGRDASRSGSRRLRLRLRHRRRLRPCNATGEQLESVARDRRRAARCNPRWTLKREAAVQVEAEAIMVTGARSSENSRPRPHKGMTGSPRQSARNFGRY